MYEKFSGAQQSGYSEELNNSSDIASSTTDTSHTTQLERNCLKGIDNIPHEAHTHYMTPAQLTERTQQDQRLAQIHEDMRQRQIMRAQAHNERKQATK